MRTECDRGGQRWHAREVLEPKDESWMELIAKEVLEVKHIESESVIGTENLCSVVCGDAQGP